MSMTIMYSNAACLIGTRRSSIIHSNPFLYFFSLPTTYYIQQLVTYKTIVPVSCKIINNINA